MFGKIKHKCATNIASNNFKIEINKICHLYKRSNSLECLLQGLPQCSVWGPLMFNIYINGLLYVLLNTETCNYADDTLC